MEKKRNIPAMVFGGLLAAAVLIGVPYLVFIHETPMQKAERGLQEVSAKADAAEARYRKSQAELQWGRWMMQRAFAGTLKKSDITDAAHAGPLKAKDIKRLEYRSLTPKDVGKAFVTVRCPAAGDRGDMLALLHFLSKGEEKYYSPFAEGVIEDLAPGRLVTLREIKGDVAKVELKDGRMRYVPYWGLSDLKAAVEQMRSAQK